MVLQIITMTVTYILAFVGMMTLVGLFVALYFLYNYDINVNIGNTRKEESKIEEKKAAVKDASTQKT